jgi:hypothetical protein
VPESRVRKKKNFTPPSTAPAPVKFGSAAWWAPVMVGFFVLGLLWIVVYYIAPDLPPWSFFQWTNVLIGFAFIGVGFGMSTRWK